ncbi:HzsA-related protein [Sunxiuqinia sp. A32]|uniref:HzsA-related protein n=1 Tax=Sunxiuqinia sp. A32 TaxID=3461496 RepID=UPI00404654D6
MKKNVTGILFTSLWVGILCIFIFSCQQTSIDGMIICTQVPVGQDEADFVSGKNWRYPLASRIVAIDLEEQDELPVVLTKEFSSARSPEVSYTGIRMIFSAKKTEKDVWQIWEMDLSNLKSRQITDGTDDCTDPAYIPGDRIVYSKKMENDSLKSGHALFTCKLDGTNEKRITYNPANYFASTVLMDGRVLTISRQQYPEIKESMFMVMRPDGSKQEMFYKGKVRSELLSRPLETGDGKIIFCENGGADQENSLLSIKYSRPLHSVSDLSGGFSGGLYGFFPMKIGEYLVSYRPSASDRYSLYRFNPVTNKPEELIFRDEEYDITEITRAEKRERPRKLPSEITESASVGLIMCQDINFSGDLNEMEEQVDPVLGVTMEVLGLNSSLGEVAVEPDGSFYLKVDANTPFRLQTLDKDGKVINGPSSWIYLRSNERRGCVGCHEDREQAPDNRQPMAIRKDPVRIGSSIQGTTHGTIDLEHVK